MINYDIIKRLMLSTQSRIFFVQLIVAAIIFAEFFSANLFFAKFRIVFSFFRFIQFRKKMRNFAKKIAFSHFFAKVFVRWKTYLYPVLWIQERET